MIYCALFGFIETIESLASICMILVVLHIVKH
jgi:hypothetical protein